MTSVGEQPPTDTEESGRYASFVKFFKRWLMDLEINLKLFVEVMEDAELPMSARLLAIGVLMYVTMARDMIPEKLKTLRLVALVDDILVMAVGLALIVPVMPENSRAYYRQKYGAVGKIDEYEQLLQSSLGILWGRLVQFVDKLRLRPYKKRTPEDIAGSADLQEDLFDEAMIFVANLNLDHASINQQLTSLPPPETIMGLLSSGLQEGAEESTQGEPSERRSVLRRLLPLSQTEDSSE